jgi:hypothetical protein
MIKSNASLKVDLSHEKERTSWKRKKEEATLLCMFGYNFNLKGFPQVLAQDFNFSLGFS